MAQATKITGAESVRWDLSDLFKSPTDPAIGAALAEALKRAQAFEERYKGKVVSLPPKEFAAMMRELEDDEELAAKPDVYAYLLHSQNTGDPAAGRLLARVREAGAERGSHGVFFTLELASRQMPLEEALVRLREADRKVRREASGAITTALAADVKTRGYIFNVILGEKAIDDRLRHFPTWISSRNLANETSDEAVQALVEAVTGRYDVCVRYYRVKKQLLGVGELHEWDRYAPVGEAARELTWEEAKELVLGSYRRFSKRAGDLVDDFFKHGWIDAPVVPGKAGGAYCMPVTPHHHPYVMLNFTGKLRDALVMAHELGHGLHDRLASKNHIFDFHPPLTLAETASVFGEALTFDRIMSEEKDPKVRLAMLCTQCEDAFSTVFRQVAFNRYEDACHTMRRKEGELAVEQLGELFQEKLQVMFGDALILTDEHKVWWSYVGHFLHTPGYVYAYAFGNLLALSIYHRYLQVGPSFVDDYLEFLAAGGSTRPDELVRRLGMDITDPGFWDAGLKILDGMVTEVERLAPAT